MKRKELVHFFTEFEVRGDVERRATFEQLKLMSVTHSAPWYISSVVVVVVFFF